MPDDFDNIEKLTRNDYEHPFLQFLIAEIIYKTRNEHKGYPKDRFEKAMRAILGAPRRKKKNHNGRFDDEDLLIQAASMIKSCKNVSVNGACERVAKYHLIKKYRDLPHMMVPVRELVTGLVSMR